MSMGSCSKCWDANCCCGWKHRNWEKRYIIDLMNGILEYNAITKEELLEGLE